MEEAPVKEPYIQSVQKEAKSKTTLNLGNIFKQSLSKEIVSEEKPRTNSPDKPFDPKELKKVWARYAEQRKHQLAEYHLLSRGFELTGNMATIHLTNPVEEQFLQSIKSDLLGFLRESLGNYSIQVQGLLKEFTGNKIAYTNKEKFDAMAEKNPLLYQLKERFGLDPDF